MKVTKVADLEITHDDLVNFFSTALYDDNTFEAIYGDDEISRNVYETYSQENPEACFEDFIAEMLLRGGYIGIVDREDSCDTAEEALKDNGKNAIKPSRFFKDEYYWTGKTYYYPVYKITLADIKNQFIKIIEGRAECTYDNIAKNFAELFGEDGNPDFYDAWNLLQFVIFDDVIYG